METSDIIIDGLCLGGIMAALNERDLQLNKITHILSVDEKPLPDILTSKFTYKHVFALDLYDFDLLSVFPECFSFVDLAREGGGAVLVHCQAGISRSATVVVAYIMQKLQLTKEKALERVCAVRHFVKPNDGFQHQLQLFENMGSQVDKKHPEFRAYQLSKLAVRFKCGQYAEGVPESEIPLEVFVAPDYSAKGNDAYYKCRKCRTFLFHDGALSTHNIGEGESAFDWRSKVPVNKRTQESPSRDEAACRRSLFVDPLAWMKGKIHAVQGKLNCPKCDTKIGSYVWFGEKCPCGAWVAPAFHIGSGKVDKIPSQPVTPRTHIHTSDNSPSQPHLIGAVTAYPSPSAASGRSPGHLTLPSRTSSADSRLSIHPVAAVQPRMASSVAQSTSAAASVQSMDFEMSGGNVDGGQRDVEQAVPGNYNRDIESGINSIHMDVDSG